MDYKLHYDKLISTRKNRALLPTAYYEKHHIIPKSLGGDDSIQNTVMLTAKEHFLAHWLLYRIHGIGSMAFAFFRMCHQQNGKISSRAYAEAKEARSLSMKNRVITEETRKKIGDRRRKIPEDSIVKKINATLASMQINTNDFWYEYNRPRIENQLSLRLRKFNDEDDKDQFTYTITNGSVKFRVKKEIFSNFCRNLSVNKKEILNTGKSGIWSLV